MSFADYYRHQFLDELQAVYAGAPSVPVCENWARDPHLTPTMLGSANRVLRHMSGAKREQFAMCLYFTVLVDQVMYTHFSEDYQEFRSLTQYPKWRGDCPGGCHSHWHPASILSTIGAASHRGSAEADAVDWISRLQDALPLFYAEINQFFGPVLPRPVAAVVWQRVIAEEPLAQVAA